MLQCLLVRPVCDVLGGVGCAVKAKVVEVAVDFNPFAAVAVEPACQVRFSRQ